MKRRWKVWVVLILTGFLIFYAVTQLHLKSNCEQRGGSFSFAVPSVCTYPLGSPYAPGGTQSTPGYNAP